MFSLELMPNISSSAPQTQMANPYEQRFQTLLAKGIESSAAALMTAERYVDQKPVVRNKRKLPLGEHDEAFWSSSFLMLISPDGWGSEIGRLAIVRYLKQSRISRLDLLVIIARTASDALIWAIRRSRVGPSSHADRFSELQSVGMSCSVVAEQCEIISILSEACQAQTDELERCKARLAELSPFELLLYGSLFAYAELVPLPSSNHHPEMEKYWEAINDLLIWKIASVPESAIKLNIAKAGRSLATHVSPLIFPSSRGQPARYDLYEAFEELLAAQLELNAINSRSVDAYCYDDSILFVRNGKHLEIEQTDPAVRDKWRRDGEKLAKLHGYWLHRGMQEYVNSPLAEGIIGKPENHELNEMALIGAMSNRSLLDEVYGIDDRVLLETGTRVPLFKALLALELSSVFYQSAFLRPFGDLLKETGDCLVALRMLCMRGWIEGMQNRLPLTFANRVDKINAIRGWVASDAQPQGDPVMAAAVLDFWTSDWSALSGHLRNHSDDVLPNLLERPFLKMGELIVQLPWLTGLQNNRTAAINNLRRIGHKRSEVKEETTRIEHRLGALFAQRGFRVKAGWVPDRDTYDDAAGEVDLICAMDGFVLVIEVKSSYVRKTQREAWLHASTTLRKAGNQLQRKTTALMRALTTDAGLCADLGLRKGIVPSLTGWIIDTSIECDHERFSGFLKISLEEVIIALRNDRHLLSDPYGILKAMQDGVNLDAPDHVMHDAASLYPQGFSAARFVDVIESEAVWSN